MDSPYANQPIENWLEITKKLIKEHPLSTKELIGASLGAWKDILKSGIGEERFKIGKDIFPAPQIMGYLLHELISLKIIDDFPKYWRKEKTVSDKDIVCLKDIKYSIEIKTSSNKNRIFGNRSYGQNAEVSKKSKSGYYLAINFEKFSESQKPKIRLIRFGWIDHSDWISQKAATGQQARLSPETRKYKLIEIYRD